MRLSVLDVSDSLKLMTTKQHSPAMFKRYLKSILKYILELLIVAFGVFLGFYLSEKSNQENVDANTRNALEQIIAEMKANARILESAVAYHEQLALELDSALQGLGEEDFRLPYYGNPKINHNKLPSWKGVGTVRLSETIYESAKISGVFQDLNISTIQLISSIYEFHDVYAEFTKSTVDQLLALDSESKTGDVLELLGRLCKYDIVSIERGLLGDIQKQIVELEARLENKSYTK